MGQPEKEMDIMMVYATTAIAVAIILAMMLMSTKSLELTSHASG